MYREHVPIIAKAMRDDKHIFARGVMFAILSARVQFPRVPAQCRELAKRKGDASCLWGFKFEAYKTLMDRLDELHFVVAQCPHEGKFQVTQHLLTLCRSIHGLGLVKGGFVLQLMGHDVACLDTINIIADGRKAEAYKTYGDKYKETRAFGLKAERYVIDTWGKAGYYWDRWCDAQAEKYAMTGEQISRMHVDAIVPRQRLLTIEKELADTVIPF